MSVSSRWGIQTSTQRRSMKFDFCLKYHKSELFMYVKKKIN